MRRALCAVPCLLLIGCTSSVAGQPRPAEETSAWAATLNGSAEQIEARHAGAAPPAFPEKIEGYNLSREWRDTVRAFERTDWSTLYEFPATMNGCDMQRFFIRWRAVNEDAVIDSTFVSTGDLIALADPVSGATGWMAGYGCSQPAFRMQDSAGPSNLTDVVVEVQQWEVSV